MRGPDPIRGGRGTTNPSAGRFTEERPCEGTAGRRPSPPGRSGGKLDLGYLTSKTEEMKFCCLSHPVCSPSD